jgi:hypothetical protein
VVVTAEALAVAVGAAGEVDGFVIVVDEDV